MGEKKSTSKKEQCAQKQIQVETGTWHYNSPGKGHTINSVERAGEKILDPHTTQQRKFNSKWNEDLNVKSNTLKFLDENIEFFITWRQGSTQKREPIKEKHGQI